MEFLFRSTYVMPELAPLMIFLISGWYDFHLLSFSDRNMSGNVWNHPSGRSMFDLCSHQTFSYEVSFSDVTWHSGTWLYTVTPSIYQTLHQFLTLLPTLTLFPTLTLVPNFGRFSWNIATGAASQKRTLTPSHTWSCPIVDLHLF